MPADKVVIGASIRYGKHQPEVYDFISEHQSLLEDRPNAFFTVNVVARKPEKNTPDTNPYLIKFLKQISWTHRNLGVLRVVFCEELDLILAACEDACICE